MSRSSTGQIVPPSSTSSSQTLGNRISRALSTPELFSRIQGKPSDLSNALESPVPSPSSPKLFRPPLSMPIRAQSLQVPKPAPDRTFFKFASQPRSSDNVNVADAAITSSMSDSAHKTQRFAGENVVYCNDEVCFHTM